MSPDIFLGSGTGFVIPPGDVTRRPNDDPNSSINAVKLWSDDRRLLGLNVPDEVFPPDEMLSLDDVNVFSDEVELTVFPLTIVVFVTVLVAVTDHDVKGVVRGNCSLPKVFKSLRNLLKKSSTGLFLFSSVLSIVLVGVDCFSRGFKGGGISSVLSFASALPLGGYTNCFDGNVGVGEKSDGTGVNIDSSIDEVDKRDDSLALEKTLIVSESGDCTRS